MEVSDGLALPNWHSVRLTMVTGLHSEAEKNVHDDARRQAFESLIQQSWDRLWSYAYRTTGNRDDAEDLLSESLLEGFRSFHQFRGDTPFIRWMFRVMTTTRIDMVRRASRGKTTPLSSYFGEGEENGAHAEIADETGDPQRMVLTRVLEETIQRALS